MSEVYINGRRIRLDPAASKGKGGEADIYSIGQFYNDSREIAAKIYKGPDHPDYKNADGSPNAHEQKGAENRLLINQTKLRDFPQNLPSQVIAPIDFATDKSGKLIRGFTLEFLAGYNLLIDFKFKTFRQGGGIGQDLVCDTFSRVYDMVTGIHTAGVVIGDFNDLNVMVSPKPDLKIKLIDADSMQFGKFYCGTFTQTFVDPILCISNPDPNVSGPILQKPHNQDSDWYAFAVMFMQSLLFLDSGPYGGMYKPKDKTKRIANSDRWADRITVFHPEVVYPKPSIPLSVLPDDLLQMFHNMFVKDKRDKFPSKLLNLTWTTCNCGATYARNSCPICNTASPFQPTQVVRVHGKVKVTQVFKKPGVVITYATTQNGDIKYVYHDGQTYRRESNEPIGSGPLDSQIRFRINGPQTIMGKGNSLLTFEQGQVVDKSNVDCYGILPVFDANKNNRFWLYNGNLLRNKEVLGLHSSEVVGQVLANQTLFWVGSKLGFGFYRAGDLSRAFVFATDHLGINDSVDVPIRGQLIDSTCVFSDKLCWFFVSTREGSKMLNHCHVIQADGKLVASVTAEQGNEPWLDHLRGKMAAGHSLFIPTDDGMIRMNVVGGRIQKAAEFPDTAVFVTSGSVLLPGKQGVFVVENHEIQVLQMQP